MDDIAKLQRLLEYIEHLEGNLNPYCENWGEFDDVPDIIHEMELGIAAYKDYSRVDVDQWTKEYIAKNSAEIARHIKENNAVLKRMRERSANSD